MAGLLAASQSLGAGTGPQRIVLHSRDANVLAAELVAAFPEAVLALRRAACSLVEGGRILLLEDTQDIDHAEGPDEHDAEADLLNLTLTGGGFRTVTELETVIADAGLKFTAAEVVGWGSVLRTLGRA